MNFLRITVFLIGLVTIGVCAAYGQREIPKDFFVSFERYPCFGSCPHYSLTIAADGRMEFTPLGKSVYRGDGDGPSPPLKGSIAADQLSVLLAEFQKAKFSSLRKRYGSPRTTKEGPSCPEYWTDNPSANISIVMNGKRKTVFHYLGCRGAKVLDDLKALEDKIDEIANSRQWTSQFGWGVASVVDLRLQINPAKPSQPEKP